MPKKNTALRHALPSLQGGSSGTVVGSAVGAGASGPRCQNDRKKPWKITCFHGTVTGKITCFHGNITCFHGKITCFHGKIHYFDWAIFNSELFVYQRVDLRALFQWTNPLKMKYMSKIVY